MSKKYRFIVLSLILIAVSLLIMMHNFPRIHHFGGIHLQLTDKEILQTATEILQEFGITSDDIYSSINVRADQNFYTFLHREYGVRYGNELMRQGLPAAYYQLRWHDDPPSFFRILPATEPEQRTAEEPETELRILNNTRINLDVTGNVLFIRYPISETISLPSLTVDEARETAYDFIDRHTPFSTEEATVESERSSELDTRTDHRFTITAYDDRIDKPVTINLTVSGTLITSMVSSYDTPRYPELAQMEALVQAPIYIVTIISVLLAIILGIKRIRSGEIGYRIGLTFGVIAGIGFLFGMIFILGDEFVIILLLFFRSSRLRSAQ